MRKLRYIKLFEEWSPSFHKTLQAAYLKAKETNKGFGRVAKDILAYAQRQISSQEFTVYDEFENEYIIVYDEAFLISPLTLKGIQFKVKLKSINGNQTYPVFVDTSFLSKTENRDISGFFGNDLRIIPSLNPLKFNLYWGASLSIERENINDNLSNMSRHAFDALWGGSEKRKRNQPEFTKQLPQIKAASKLNIRFKSQKELEDFIAMYIQAVISDNSKVEWELSEETKKMLDNDGISTITLSPTKNWILFNIQKLIDKDIRNFL